MSRTGEIIQLMEELTSPSSSSTYALNLFPELTAFRKRLGHPFSTTACISCLDNDLPHQIIKLFQFSNRYTLIQVKILQFSSYFKLPKKGFMEIKLLTKYLHT